MKWNQDGDKITTASGDKTVKVIEFHSGKTLSVHETADGSNYPQHIIYSVKCHNSQY